MPKRKASAWPASILSDPDVLSLDDDGRSVICKVCHVHYAVNGGKKPKPVIMNSSFRTRAWEVHKERTNSHRLHKKAMQERPRAQSVDEDEHKESDIPTQLVPVPEADVEVDAPATRPTSEILPSSQPQRQPQPRRSTRRSVRPDLGQDSFPRIERSHDEERTQPLSLHQRIFGSANHATRDREWSDESPSDMGFRQRDPSANDGPMPRMTSKQVDGLQRWRNMHEDVSRALGSKEKRGAYQEMANTPPDASTERGLMANTQDFGSDNNQVAKKLKSLDAEYDAKVLKHPEVFCDGRNESYKQYWGTLRDVYGSANKSSSTLTSGSGGCDSKPTHAGLQQQRSENPSSEEQVEGTSPPDDSESAPSSVTGSSEDAVTKPTPVHDPAMISAIDRLTSAVAKHFSSRTSDDTMLILNSLGELAESVGKLRVQQDAAFSRLIELQESKLQLTEEMLMRRLDLATNAVVSSSSESQSRVEESGTQDDSASPS